MNAHEAQKLIIQGLIAGLSEEDQRQIDACVHDLKNAMAKYSPEHSHAAIAVIGSGLAALN